MIGRSAILWVALLGGCAMGPDYRPPVSAPDLTGPLPYRPQGLASVSPTPQRWWQLYKDPVLDQLVDDAITANTDLRAAEAHFEAARAQLRLSRAAELPSTNLTAGGSYGRTPTATQIANSAGREARSTWLFETGFDTAYEVDLFGRVRRSVEAAHADEEAAAAARDAVRIAVVAETVRDYISACALGHQLDVAQNAVMIAEQQRDIVRLQTAAGGGSDFDVARQDSLVSRTRSEIPGLEGERRASLFALAEILGRPPGGVPVAASDCHVLPDATGPIPVGDGAALLDRRPDVREAERKMAAASARIGVAKAELLPRITLLGSVSSVEPDLPALGTHAATSFALGPLISWNFPNIAAARAKIEAANAADRAAIADYDGVVLGALKDVEQALARYAAAVDRERELLAAERQARTAFNLARSRLAAGSISELDLLVAQQSLIDVELAVAAAEASRAGQLVGLFKALGGGGNDPVDEPV